MNDKLNRELIQAVKYKNLEEIRRLLKDGADPNAGIDDGWTALMEAANIGDKETFLLLIDKKREVDKQKSYGWTALMEAAHRGHSEIVDLLIREGADPNLRLNSDWTALSAAKESGNSETIRLLEKEIERRKYKETAD